MKSKLLLLFFIFSISAKINAIKAQVIASDSLALVDFYNNTGGASWSSIHWDFNTYVGNWAGITIDIGTKRITDIDLQNQNIPGSIPTSFGNLTGLLTLNLSFNKITAIPSSIGNIVGLTSIKLRNNLIASPLPSTLQNLINLTVLDFENNSLSGSIPAFFSNAANLEKVFLGENNFTGSIPEYFGSLTKLTTLYLHSNKLSGHIPEGLSNSGKPLTGGMYLEISNCQYTFADIEPFAQLVHDKFEGSPENYAFIYSPQALIPIKYDTATLAVSPGGSFGKDTIRWYKNSNELVATTIGDTTFAPNSAGLYQARITNAVATDLVLLSDSLYIDYQLPDTSLTGVQNVTGTNPVTISNGINKIVTVKPTPGANALAGNVTASLIIDPSVSTYNSQPYVQRHYDIAPANNASTAKATITLYFTQQDFDNFNTYIIANSLSLPLLPTNKIDNGNVRITQFHGSFTGTSNPTNYSGATVIITPTVIWNNISNDWEVTFPVSGFSGFFVSTAYIALPLQLLNFSGIATNGKIILNWKTAEERNTKSFVIQKSSGTQFEEIASVTASGLADNTYSYTDLHPLSGNNYYRLKMTDKDGQSKLSDVIKINFETKNGAISVYPNPVTTTLNLKITASKRETILIQLSDALGKIVLSKNVVVLAGTQFEAINVTNLIPGVYYLNSAINGNKIRVSFVK